MKRWLFVFLVLVVLLMPTAVFAAKTADVVITATPGYISISVDPGVWNPSVTESTTENTTTTYFTVTNACTIVTDQTIGVNTTDNWSGGAGWIHSDTCVPAVATVGLKANKGGTWGTSDITVPKIASAAMLSDNQTTGGSYQFGLSIWAPTSFLDGDAKVVTTRITAAAAN